MSGGRIETGRHLERLFGVGVVGGLSDAELLERFAAVDDESAAAAFEVIVARHGPMVLRVCRRILRDAHAAEDAFQATFLVLARRARTLGERELLGNWLYGVAMRTSRKARVAAARRVARDRIAAGRRSETIVDPAADERGDLELGRILHEEIGRLPDSYRAAVVACYLEGLTQAEAARQLRMAESTVRGRLDRARKLLRQRLSRRGIGPSVAVLALDDIIAGTRLPGSATPMVAGLPDVIVRSVARDALQFARSAGPAMPGAVASTAVALADGVLHTMWLPSIKTVSLAAALAAVGLGLTVAAAELLSSAPTSVASDVLSDPGPASPGPQESGDGRQRPATKGPKYAPHVKIAEDLSKRTPGPIVRGIPVTKDCMLLAYLPDQNVGHVDNFGLANNSGGVRVLIDWPDVPADDALAPDHRFLLALYSRRTTSHSPAGRIHGFEVLDDWRELNSWSRQPRYDPEPIATYSFEPGDGWKLFDLTPMIRAQAMARRSGHGVLLRFLSEDFSGPRWSGYDLVSREGAGEWAGRHPVLLIVKDTKSEKAETK